MCGTPTALTTALWDSGARDLSIVSNNMGVDERSLSILLESHQLTKVLGSYVGASRILAEQ